MKNMIMKATAKVARNAAEFSSETMSFMWLYQPKTPKALKKPENKNNKGVN